MNSAAEGVLEYESVSGLVLRIASAWYIRGYETQDLVGEARLAWHRQLRRFDASRASLATWTRRVAESCLCDLRDREEADIRAPLNTASADPEELEEVPGQVDVETQVIEADELRRTCELVQEIRGLLKSDRERAVVEAFLAGETDVSVAKRLSITQQSASAYRRRLFDRIRTALEQRGLTDV
jgi:RNA polymerase sigma factor (sigma-70 family)